jgi:hypothetical protein
VVKVEKGWVEQEFVLLFVAALPNEAGLPNEEISHWILLKADLDFQFPLPKLATDPISTL